MLSINVMKIEYYYAPVTGGVMKVVEGTPVKQDNWAEVTLILQEFLELRRENKIQLDRTITAGHDLFNGHSGLVYVYGQKEEE